jgi:hypothetical protein
MTRFGTTVMCVAVCAAIAAGSMATAGQPAKQTASQFYMAYRAAFEKATKIEDVLPYMCAANRQQVESTPAADRGKIFGMIKMLDAHTNIKVVKEDHQSDGSVVLGVSAYDTDQKQNVTAAVTILKEDGMWKLGKESWKSGS